MLYTLLFCATVSFICITINSENSFLYKFQQCDDMQCFMTTARCMLRGDVLYRDVYEHKGLYLYGLYILAHLISSDSFIGVYLIELVAFAAFMFFSIQTLRLFCRYDVFNFAAVALIAVRTTSANVFRGGGEAEELVLPLLAASVYLMMRNLAVIPDPSGRQGYEKRTGTVLSSWSERITCDAVFVGLMFAVAFWMKYTLTGAFIGMALTVIIIGIKHKDKQFILKCAVGFLAGTLLGTLPVIIYFAAHHAMGDLWGVYFYTLIFKYGNKDGSVFVKFLHQLVKMQKYYVLLPFMLLLLDGVIRGDSKASTTNDENTDEDKKKKCENVHLITPELRLMGLMIIAFSVLGNAVGKVQSYTCEMQHAFSVLGFCSIFCIARKLFMRGRKLAKDRHDCISADPSAPQADIVVLKTDRIYDRAATAIYGYYLKLHEEWEQKYRKKINGSAAKAVCLILLTVYYVIMVYIPSPFRMFMKYALEDYAVYRMSAYMLERSPEPRILYLNCSDHGLNYLTGTYPMGKYFGNYALYTPEELGYYERYLETGSADYVLAVNEEVNLSAYGYTEVMSETSTPFILEGQFISFYFYARDDLEDVGVKRE